MVLPDERMAALVTAINGPNTLAVAQRILLRALVAKGRIAAMPAPVAAVPLPVKTPTPAELAAVTGYYASDSALRRVLAGNAGTLSVEQLADNAWSPLATGLLMRNDGWFSSDGKPATEFRHLNAGAGYLQAKDVTGAGHYRDQFLFGQRLSTVGTGALSPAWQSRLARKWLIVNFRPDVLHFSHPRYPAYPAHPYRGRSARGASDSRVEQHVLYARPIAERFAGPDGDDVP